MEKQFLIDLVGEEAAQTVWEAHQGALEQRERLLRGDFAIREAIYQGGGRNEAAIRALMDMEAICAAQDPAAEAAKAVAKLRRTDAYLFRAPQAYAAAAPAPVSREDLAAMTMEEYKRFRKR